MNLCEWSPSQGKNESEETPFSVRPATAATAERRFRFLIAKTNSGL